MQRFLKKKGINCYEIKGYISKYFCESFENKKKENFILYNPVKDRTHAKKLIELFPEYKFIAVSNFDKYELKNIYLKSKIFLDYGPHPGRERMPREAVAMGCVLLLANRGSVVNDFDVPIDKIYKFDLTKKDVYLKTGKLIKEIFYNYENHWSSFENFRKKILFENEFGMFDKNVMVFASNMIEKG